MSFTGSSSTLGLSGLSSRIIFKFSWVLSSERGGGVTSLTGRELALAETVGVCFIVLLRLSGFLLLAPGISFLVSSDLTVALLDIAGAGFDEGVFLLLIPVLAMSFVLTGAACLFIASVLAVVLDEVFSLAALLLGIFFFIRGGGLLMPLLVFAVLFGVCVVPLFLESLPSVFFCWDLLFCLFSKIKASA